MFRFTALLLLLCALAPSLCEAREAGPEARIGVLANRGKESCLEQWSPLIRTLSDALPDVAFTLVPLDFEDVDRAAAEATVDYILANPAIYVNLEVRYRAMRIATLVNQLGDRITASFGGVIFTRAGRGDINTFQDIRGRSFAATSEGSMGGWLVGLSTLCAQEVDPRKACSQLTFPGSHNAVVQLVLSGGADAGTVRTDTLERMAQKGQISLEDVKVLLPPDFKPDPAFPFLYSTELVPEWPFARLAHTPEAQAKAVAAVLLTIPAVQTPDYGAQWTVPLDYEPIHRIMRELRVPPYEDHGRISVKAFTSQHGPLVAVLGSLLLALVLAALYLVMLNSRLQEAMANLREAEAELTTRADTDMLTGLCNRRRFSEIVNAEIARALRYERPLSLILMDMDHFKLVNDTWGHPVGDEVLREVSGRVRHSARSSDFVARLGGEEFAVLLPETTLEDAVALAERIRQAVSCRPAHMVGAQELNCTLSLGVAEVCPSIQDFSALYKAVDEALYRAKRQGRNRTAVSSFCVRNPA
ncbi:diguanylate cyclase [Fundidesulfovibrio agrisoli]|uniref:diguanylate cyclase n=1 Tax=Fundidesulfovibrio agrisoli TaxID=2922717 RepID=UPI001FAD60C0|nr:diguanylate cyclase [Fundidesulfovibrio agrisoli]